jgi:hypothetical protein
MQRSSLIYEQLTLSSISIIYSRLQSAKLPTEDYKTLVETHRPSTELAKTNYFMEALKSDYAGHEASREFVRAHPQVATRTFANLVATVFLHAPTSVPTTSAFGYTNAQTTTSVAFAAPIAPTTEAALVAHIIAESQRKLSAMRRTGRQQRTSSCSKSCYPSSWRTAQVLLQAWLPA